MTGGEPPRSPSAADAAAAAVHPGSHGGQQPLEAAERPVSSTTGAVGTPAAAAGGTSAAPRRSRARAAVICALLGLVLVTAGLYLVGEFGVRLLDAATTVWTASTADIALATAGAVCLFAAVLLNGWSPWATALPGVLLTAAGVWSIVSVDGADRVAAIIDGALTRGDPLRPVLNAWVLVIGLLLLGASMAVTIARSAGRSRGRT